MNLPQISVFQEETPIHRIWKATENRGHCVGTADSGPIAAIGGSRIPQRSDLPP
jgi:hypothetical protein